MTATVGDLALTRTWQDIVVTYAAANNVPVRIQNVSETPILIVWGGAAPTTQEGEVVQPGEAITGSAVNIWARSVWQAGKLTVTLP
jgi:hypothetical protein